MSDRRSNDFTAHARVRQHLGVRQVQRTAQGQREGQARFLWRGLEGFDGLGGRPGHRRQFWPRESVKGSEALEVDQVRCNPSFLGQGVKLALKGGNPFYERPKFSLVHIWKCTAL